MEAPRLLLSSICPLLYVACFPSLASAFSNSVTSRLGLPRFDPLGAAFEEKSPSVVTSHLVAAYDAVKENRVPLTRTEVECVVQGLDAAGRLSVSQALKGWRAPAGYEAASLTEPFAPDVGEWEKVLHTWRRNVALRQNRVLMPARAAQLYTAVMSSCIYAAEDEMAIRVLAYVGLTPRQYLDEEQGAIDLNTIGHTVSKVMLDLNLEALEWQLVGKDRGQAQPLTSREKNEDIAEWHWSQVMPVGGIREVEFRAIDMILSVLRLSLRYAPTVGVSDVAVTLQAGTESDPYTGLQRRGFLVPPEAVQAIIMATSSIDGSRPGPQVRVTRNDA